MIQNIMFRLARDFSAAAISMEMALSPIYDVSTCLLSH